jgi:hypothetical protein
MSSPNKPSMSWRASAVQTCIALAGVIVADLFGNIGALGVYYFLGLFAAIAVGLLPVVILAWRKKKVLLDHYKQAFFRFSIWLSVILAANVFASAWAIFKLAGFTGQMFAGPLAIGLFFLLILFANRAMNILIPFPDASSQTTH